MKGYTQLTLPERKKIEEAYAKGLSVQEISRRVGRHRGTIYRELKKAYTGELDQNMRDGYSAEIAQAAQNEVIKQRSAHCKSVADKKWSEYRKEKGA